MVMLYQPYALGRQHARRSGRRAMLALAVALGLPLLAGIGYTVDTVRGYAVQARLSQAVDAAALAGGRVRFDDQRDGHIRTFFANAFPVGFLGAQTAPLTIADAPSSAGAVPRAAAPAEEPMRAPLRRLTRGERPPTPPRGVPSARPARGVPGWAGRSGSLAAGTPARHAGCRPASRPRRIRPPWSGRIPGPARPGCG